MELYNIDKGKLRKKDRAAYYYDDNKKFIQVPNMTDDKEKIYEFVKFCVKIKHPKVSSTLIDEEWLKLEKNTPIIIDALKKLKEEAEQEGALIYKILSYDKAIKTIENINVPIASGDQAQKLPGIGKGTAAVIGEILRHGRLRTQEERMEAAIKREDVTSEFLKVWDVNKKVANQWYSFGHKTLDDVSSDTKYKFTEKQKLGLKYFDDLQKIIPEQIVRKVYESILKSKKLPKDVIMAVVGPYRRGKDEIKVIELLGCVTKVSKIATRKIVDALKSIYDVKEGSLDAKKFSGLVEVEGVMRRIDIFMVPKDECGPHLIQYTGPESFVKLMKEQAAVMGYGFAGKQGFVRFSETADDKDEKIDAPTERDVFDELGMKFIEPEDRD